MISGILKVIEEGIKDLGIFNNVERGLKNIEDIKLKEYPCVRYNIDHIEKNEVLSTFNRQVYTAYIDYILYYKSNKNKNYFEEIDNIRDKILKYFSCLLPDIHEDCLGINFEVAKELINDDYLNGAYVVKIVVSIDYK